MTRTKIIKINDKDSVEDAIIEASAVLDGGDIIAYPTDTLYGLGVNADDQNALNKLNDLKKRTGEKYTEPKARDFFQQTTPPLLTPLPSTPTVPRPRPRGGPASPR